MHKKDLREAMQRLLDSKEAYVLEVMVPYTEHVLPMIPAGRPIAISSSTSGTENSKDS